jgi:flagellar motor switch protein FliM
MYVGNKQVFGVKPGIRKNRIAVKVTDIVRRGDEENE